MKKSNTKLLVLVAAFSLLPPCKAFSDSPLSKSTQPDITVVDKIAASTPSVARMNNEVSDIRLKLRETEERLSKQIAGLQSSFWEKLAPGGLGLIGVLFGTGLGGWLSYQTQKRQLAAESKQTAKEVVANLMDFRSRQLNEFYAPMQFLVHGTRKIRRQVLETILNKSGENGEFMKDGDGDDIVLRFRSNGKDFKLTQNMHLVREKYDEAMPLIGEIVNIGGKISSLIVEKGGLADSGSTELADELSAYLAHYSILKDVYTRAKKNPNEPPSVDYQMTFPPKLEELLRADHEEIYNQITSWSDNAQKLLNEPEETRSGATGSRPAEKAGPGGMPNQERTA